MRLLRRNTGIVEVHPLRQFAEWRRTVRAEPRSTG
jgi:hypothetical protein